MVPICDVGLCWNIHYVCKNYTQWDIYGLQDDHNSRHPRIHHTRLFSFFVLPKLRLCLAIGTLCFKVLQKQKFPSIGLIYGPIEPIDPIGSCDQPKNRHLISDLFCKTKKKNIKQTTLTPIVFHFNVLMLDVDATSPMSTHLEWRLYHDNPTPHSSVQLDTWPGTARNGLRAWSPSRKERWVLIGSLWTLSSGPIGCRDMPEMHVVLASSEFIFS